MTTFTLKVIALISMMIHTAETTFLISQPLYMEWFGMTLIESVTFSQWVGAAHRLAFPIFAFLIAEGCRHTKSRKKYLMRLLIFGVISELPFDVMSGVNAGPEIMLRFIHPLRGLNVFFTHAMGVGGIMVYDHLRGKGKKPWLCALSLLPILLLATVLETDYSFAGLLVIWAAYFPKKRWQQILAMLAALAVLYLGYANGLSFPINGAAVKQFFASCAALILIALYNGKPGRRCKWLFYIAYPAHMALFAGIHMLMYW